MTLINQCQSVYFGTFVVRTDINVYFRTGTTRTGVAHFPEIIFFISVDDTVFRQVLFPIACSLVVALQSFGGTSFKYGGIQTVRIQLKYLNKVFPCPVDSLFLEIIAKRPVSQHLEHGVVVRIMSYLFKIIMLTAYAKTFLRIRNTGIFYGHISQNNIFKLIHPCIGKHQCRVSLNYHRCGRYNLVLLGCKERFK